MQKFWAVWKSGTSEINTQHSTLESALMEAQRLAEKTRIGAFIVLEAVSVVKAEVVVNIERPEPPAFVPLTAKGRYNPNGP